MWTFVLRRLLIGLITLLIVSVIIFAATELLPGDVATAVLGQYATPQTIAAMRHDLQLDRPAPLRYLLWLREFLSGDFGISLARREPVAPLLLDRLDNTLLLAGSTAVIAVPLALLLGIVSANFRYRTVDRVIGTVTLVFVSVPEFLVGYVLIIVFARLLHILPSLADVPKDAGLLARVEALALPILTLVLVVLGYMVRMTRAAILSVLDSSYIEMARLKGTSEWRLIARHALPNVISPIANVIALNLAYLVVGVIIVEVIFVYPGMGQLMVDAVAARDVPIVQACGVVFGLTYVILNMLADIAAILGNPRLRVGARNES
jgi:peptide/nickel transport system permease protein